MSQLPDTFARRRRVDTQRVLLMALFARMDTLAMSIATGTVGALALFLATAVLLINGAPPGIPVGPNLVALSTFLPGYNVTWFGGVLGAIYGFATGAAIGFVLSVLWNFVHIIYVGFAVMKGGWLD